MSKHGLDLLHRAIRARDVVEKDGAIDCGICYMISNVEQGHITTRQKELLKFIFVTWEKFSGNEEYPVPCPNNKCPEEAYWTLPIWEGEYGELRRELLDYTIERLQYFFE